MKVLSALTALVATVGLASAAKVPMSPGRTPMHDPTEEAVRQFESPSSDQGGPQPGMVLQSSRQVQREGQTCFEVVYKMDDTAKGKSLADTLTLDRRGRVWWDYAREVDSITSRLMTVGQSTLLVPTDSAIMKLARKPHQNTNGETTDDEAQLNVERFLAAHIIPDFNEPTTDGRVKNLLGSEVEIVEGKTKGSYVVKPGDIEVVELSQANNGRILYLNGVLPFRE